MSKHAKGKWWYQEDTLQKIESENNCKELGLPISKHKHFSVHSGTGHFVAYCGCHNKTLANARLITAAPDLLRTVEDIASHEEECKRVNIGYDVAVHILAQDIIAKIEGN